MALIFTSSGNLPSDPIDEGEMIEYEGFHFTKSAWAVFQKHPEKFQHFEVGKHVHTE